MRARLVSDLTLANCELQGAVLGCLCVSRCPWIKPYRDSVVRLTQSRSFREEVGLITEGMFSKPADEENNSDQKEQIVNVLTRLCFVSDRVMKIQILAPAPDHGNYLSLFVVGNIGICFESCKTISKVPCRAAACVQRRSAAGLRLAQHTCTAVQSRARELRNVPFGTMPKLV